ncbi:MAG: hypothetical protein V9G98_22630 [Candidatus Competibacter sp.]
MPLPDHLRPLTTRLGERYDIILNAAIGFNNAMRGREITLAQACDLAAFLATQLAIIEAELTDEKRGRAFDREQAARVIQSYRKTIEETQEMLKRFGWKP